MALSPDAAVVAIGLLLGLAGNTLIAVVGVRFLRVRLATRWAPIIYALVFLPVVFVPTTIIISGVIGTADVVVTPATLIGLLFLFPIGLGFAVDYFWLPPPEAIDVPDDTGA